MNLIFWLVNKITWCWLFQAKCYFAKTSWVVVVIWATPMNFTPNNPTFTFCNKLFMLATNYFASRQVGLPVLKHSASLSKLFHSNVARQVEWFHCLYYLYLKKALTLDSAHPWYPLSWCLGALQSLDYLYYQTSSKCYCSFGISNKSFSSTFLSHYFLFAPQCSWAIEEYAETSKIRESSFQGRE